MFIAVTRSSLVNIIDIIMFILNRQCKEVSPNHYIPLLYQLKYEIEVMVMMTALMMMMTGMMMMMTGIIYERIKVHLSSLSL